jgi:nucleotide-binding universal stress UspA family protein
MSRIVIGYDGSDAAKRALERAAALANGGPVVVVSAVTPLISRAAQIADPVEAEDHARHLAEAKARLGELGVDANAVEGIGDPATVIVAEAEEIGADLIVVGSEGKSLIERLLVGSVSSEVARKAAADVLVVH